MQGGAQGWLGRWRALTCAARPAPRLGTSPASRAVAGSAQGRAAECCTRFDGQSNRGRALGQMQAGSCSPAWATRNLAREPPHHGPRGAFSTGRRRGTWGTTAAGGVHRGRRRGTSTAAGGGELGGRRRHAGGLAAARAGSGPSPRRRLPRPCGRAAQTRSHHGRPSRRRRAPRPRARATSLRLRRGRMDRMPCCEHRAGPGRGDAHPSPLRLTGRAFPGRAGRRRTRWLSARARAGPAPTRMRLRRRSTMTRTQHRARPGWTQIERVPGFKSRIEPAAASRPESAADSESDYLPTRAGVTAPAGGTPQCSRPGAPPGSLHT